MMASLPLHLNKILITSFVNMQLKRTGSPPSHIHPNIIVNTELKTRKAGDPLKVSPRRANKTKAKKKKSSEDSRSSGSSKVESSETESLCGLSKYFSRRTDQSSWLAVRWMECPLSKEEEELLYEDIQDLIYLEKKRKELKQRLGQTPSDKELASSVGCSISLLYARIGKGRAARRRMVAANLPLVHSMARKFQGKGLSHQELFQVGILGLLKSTEKFNISLKTKFSTYAFYWIYERMSKLLKKVRHPMKVGRPIYETASWISKCRDAFQQSHGRDPTIDELSHASCIKNDRIRIVLNVLKPTGYLNATYAGKSADLSDVLDAKQDCLLWQTLINKELKMELIEALDLLAPRERQVLRLQCGFDNGNPLTRSEVAEILGLHYQSVMVTEKNAVKKLQNLAKKRGLQQSVSDALYGKS